MDGKRMGALVERDAKEKNLAAKLDEYLKEAMFFYDLPGICCCVESGGWKYSKVLGFANVQRKEPLREEHIFHLASVAKLITSTAVLQLCGEGKIDLEDKVVSVLPWLQIRDERLGQITLRQMLAHTAGMMDVEDYEWEVGLDPGNTGESALEGYVRSPEVKNSSLLWEPGLNRFRYSNMAYEILGCVVGKVSGIPFEEYVDEHIFKPLGMNDSTMLTFKRDPGELASPHVKDEGNRIVVQGYYPYNRAHAPSSTFTTNGEDLMKFGRAALENRLLDKLGMESCWSKQTDVPGSDEEMGIGWFIRYQDGFQLFGHEGMDDGFRASFWLCPEIDTQVGVFTNISRGRVKKINKRIFSLVVDLLDYSSLK